MLFRLWLPFFLASFFYSVFVVHASSVPPSAVLIMRMDNAQVIYAKNADKQRYPASLTKIMTLYLTLEALKAGTITLDTQMPTSLKASRQPPSKIDIAEGDLISVDMGIRALMVRSANDAAVILAEYIAGSEENFARQMTLKAKELGMLHTRFSNASGLFDRENYTTAYDLAILARALYFNFPEYYHYVGIPQMSWNTRVFENTNQLLSTVDGVNGMKTGYIAKAGYNLLLTAHRGDHHILQVYIGGRSAFLRDQHSLQYLTEAFDTLNGIPLRDNALMASTSSPLQATSSKKVKSTKKRTYNVQVGAFHSQSKAQQYGRSVTKKFSNIFSSNPFFVDKQGKVYRVRYAFPTLEAAKQACQNLIKQGGDCFVVQ